MLTELRIKNFKAWKDTEAVRMAPIYRWRVFGQDAEASMDPH